MLIKTCLLKLTIIYHFTQSLLDKKLTSHGIKFTTFFLLCQLTMADTIAAECRLTKSVSDSVEQLAKRSFIGDAISTQLAGQAQGSDTPQFLSKMEFYQAWQNWQQFRGSSGPLPKQCEQEQSQLVDCVAAEITQTRSARICSQPHTDPTCRAGIRVKPIKVAFKYTKNTAGYWILSAIYPSIYDNCG